ncbi:MAG: hypothetical protein JWP94_1689 [Mucilaginibacter sp.]|nr:hypothetical protein [Mucilaginibacter sp.]
MACSINMDILNWIGKNINEVKETLLYKRYFTNIPLEKGTDVYFLFNRLLGIDLILNESYNIKSIHLYSGNKDDIHRFPYELPFDLNFSLSRNDTRLILGPPNKSGGGDFSFIYGITPPWDKYVYDKFSLHLQFFEDHSEIALLTIGS